MLLRVLPRPKWNISLFILICALFHIPALGEELSRAQSRQILRILTETLHSPKAGCPAPLLLASTNQNGLSPQQPHLNHSYLLPLSPRFDALLQTVITPDALNTSYRPDIERASALAELVASWLSNKRLPLGQGSAETLDFNSILQPLLRAFVQTEAFYRGLGPDPAGSQKPWRPLIRSVVLCMDSTILMNASRDQGGGQLLPSNLCERVSQVAANASLQRVSPMNQMLGLWAPIHCNPGDVLPGQRIALHLVLPIPLANSVR